MKQREARVTDNTARNVAPVKPDPNILQERASNPEYSVWVGASAGTGKTKVLTDRVLRLLLPRADGRPGTAPGRIVCLTFTKAAANEMSLRINKKLGEWAVMDTDHNDPKKSLRAILESLLNYPPTDAHITAAKKLFAQVIDSAVGIQIMTIHSFCQSVLGRFPVEAGLQPDFTLIEEGQASDLMSAAISSVIERAQSDQSADSALSQAINTVISEIDQAMFQSLLHQIYQEKNQLHGLIEAYGSVEAIYANMCALLDIKAGEAVETCMQAFCASDIPNEPSLKHVAELMLEDKGKLAPVRASSMLAWFGMMPEMRYEMFGEYKSAYLTASGTIHMKSFPPAAIKKLDPSAEVVLLQEAERILDIEDKIKCIKSAALTRDMLHIGVAVIEQYNAMKKARGVLDYDDLINYTMHLLTGKSHGFSDLKGVDRSQVMPWILYKMDQGIDHILVDEAQDTNPEQWQIIEALSDEFFVGLSARDDVLRTSFTVGDIKQSIYGFQRAAPDEFKRMQGLMDQKIKTAGLINENVHLDISFRSTESVLKAVDLVFAETQMEKAVMEEGVRHEPFRQGQAGHVELWPVFETDKPEQRDFWDPPVTVHEYSTGSSALAKSIAERIRNELNQKSFLSSHGRAVQPKDYMILVRTRTAFVEQVMRALKSLNVPVSGADRMILKDQLAVQDCLSLVRFCLFPEDDLTLAEVLKSPFLSWNEEELFSLAYRRKGTLWQEVCNFDVEKINNIPEGAPCVDDNKREAARDYLSRLIGRARTMGAYEFLSFILTQHCPVDDQSGLRAICKRLGEDAFDPLQELLNAAQKFSHENIDHLQVFVDEQERKTTQLKREMEDASNQVRIMTVHGSKGLQAPIVILPDTMGGGANKIDRLLWPEKTDLNFPLFSSRKDNDPEIYRKAYEMRLKQEQDESYRQLYVAMTRATDRLYIGGYTKTKKQNEDAWYFKILEAIQRYDGAQELDDGTLVISNPQTTDPDKVEKEGKAADDVKTMPEWLFSEVGEEPLPPRPLVPSRPSEEDEDIVMSPLLAGQEKRFVRGNITHKLLEFLPDLHKGSQVNAAQKFVSKQVSDFSSEVRESIVQEVLDIIHHPEYSPFFAKGSMAEVPVTGLMDDNRIVSGQIDRLVIDDNDIWIVDYKTNRPPPVDPANIPSVYRKQLKAYKDTIQEIYPKHTIHCGILWTDGPRFVRLDV